MKLADLSESPADEAAIRTLVDAIVGQAVEWVDHFRTLTGSGGWPSVLRLLPKIIAHLYYHSDAEGLVVVVDSDIRAVHAQEHEQTPSQDCRLCQLRDASRRIPLSPRPNLKRLSVAIGLATPCIEAWYRCGQDPHVTEAAWVVALRERNFLYDSSRLKQDVYGTDRPSLELETQRAVEEARRLSTIIPRLESAFPNGFGPLARDVRTWLAK